MPDVDESKRKCGIKLTKVQEKHHGIWKCKLDVIKAKKYINGEGDIKVTVALAPQKIELSAENQVRADELRVYGEE